MKEYDRKNLRKVEIQDGNSVRTGYFHRWGDAISKGQNNQEDRITRAFVEEENGTITLVDPLYLRFTDK